MMITPQARRRITGAVQALPDMRARDRWGAWAALAPPDVNRTDVPYEIALIALDALMAAERIIEQRLDHEPVDEDLQADLLNDLGYIQAIESAFRNEGVRR